MCIQALLKEKEQVEFVKLENLAYEVGLPPIKAFYNPINEQNGETKQDEKSGLNYVVFNDEKDFLEHQQKEADYYNKYNDYAKRKQESDKQNNEMFESFSKKYPDVNVDSFTTEAQKYINPSATKGLIPFPKDTLEIFYKGKNFDSLVKSKVDEAEKALTKKLFDEWNKAGKSSLPKVKSEKAITKEDDSEKDDYDKAIDDYLN